MKRVMKIAVEPPATVELGSLLSATRYVSCDPLFTALELSVSKPWLVRPAKSRIVQSLIAAPT